LLKTSFFPEKRDTNIVEHLKHVFAELVFPQVRVYNVKY